MVLKVRTLLPKILSYHGVSSSHEQTVTIRHVPVRVITKCQSAPLAVMNELSHSHTVYPLFYALMNNDSKLELLSVDVFFFCSSPTSCEILETRCYF